MQEERQLRGQRGGEPQLGREGVQLHFFGAVVQPVVVEAEFAEGDELWGDGGGGGGGGAVGAGLGDEVGEVGHDLGAAGVVDAVAV